MTFTAMMQILFAKSFLLKSSITGARGCSLVQETEVTARCGEPVGYVIRR